MEHEDYTVGAMCEMDSFRGSQQARRGNQTTQQQININITTITTITSVLLVYRKRRRFGVSSVNYPIESGRVEEAKITG